MSFQGAQLRASPVGFTCERLMKDLSWSQSAPKPHKPDSNPALLWSSQYTWNYPVIQPDGTLSKGKPAQWKAALALARSQTSQNAFRGGGVFKRCFHFLENICIVNIKYINVKIHSHPQMSPLKLSISAH